MAAAISFIRSLPALALVIDCVSNQPQAAATRPARTPAKTIQSFILPILSAGAALGWGMGWPPRDSPSAATLPPKVALYCQKPPHFAMEPVRPAHLSQAPPGNGVDVFTELAQGESPGLGSS